MIRQLIILTLGLVLLAGGYSIYQNRNIPAPIPQTQKEIISNIKIGKYETLSKGGWEELNYIDTANAKNPEELYESFSKLYPDLTDKNSEFFIQEIIIKDDTAEVYFGGDEGAITDRMGTTGSYNYSGLVTFALTEDEKIKKVDFKLKTEGSHFGPTISTRDDFIYLWPTQLLEETANSSKQARIALASRKRLSDETSNWKTYTNKGNKYSIKYPNNWTFVENPSETFFYTPRISEDIWKKIQEKGPFSEPRVTINILSTPFSQSSSQKSSPLTKMEPLLINVNGIDGYYYQELCAPSCGINFDLPYNNGGQTLQINLMNLGKENVDSLNKKFSVNIQDIDEDVFKKILSTFRFD